jgi:hypothetical protein
MPSARPPDPIDPPMPGDQPFRNILGLAVAAWLLLLPFAVRQVFFWGEPIGELLNVASALVLVAFTLLAGTALARCLRQAGSIPMRHLVAGGLVLTALAWLLPPFLSADIHDYAARSRLQWLGHNPYVTTAAELMGDPAMTAGGYGARARWTTWPMPYGPLMAVLQLAVGWLPNAWACVYALKLADALAHVLTAFAVAATARLVADERAARRAFVLWLWNPMLLLESCSSGHNDALSALATAVMAFALAAGRTDAGAASFGCGLLVKHAAAPFAPLLLAWSLRNRQVGRLAAGCVLPLLLAVAGWFVWFGAPGALDFVWLQTTIQKASLVKSATFLFGETAGLVCWRCGQVLTLLVLAFACTRVRDAMSLARLGILVLATFLLFAVPNFSPWYHLWWLPLVALGNQPILQRAVELLAWTGPLSYVVAVATGLPGALHQAWQLLIAGMWPVLLLLLEWRTLADQPRKTTAGAAHGH